MKILSYLLLLSSLSFASDFSGKSVMNDIHYQDYKDFPEKWSLVTIRFRKDTGEMRLTYANELAMKTLTAGSTDYPDGSVFAKTGIQTGSDPQFESSVVPKGIRRYQLMVKNKSRYKTTGGWGYALFDSQGRTFPEDPQATQMACYACHTIVENRGDVFSQPFAFTKNAKFPIPDSTVQKSKLNYVWVTPKELPSPIAERIPKTFKKIRLLKFKLLQDHLFQGTLDELKPILELEAKSSKSPALFLASDKKRFVMVLMTTSDACMGGGAFEILSTNIKQEIISEKVCTHD